MYSNTYTNVFRDAYVEFIESNIQPDALPQFDVYPHVDYYGAFYDYGSVMHYDRKVLFNQAICRNRLKAL